MNKRLKQWFLCGGIALLAGFAFYFHLVYCHVHQSLLQERRITVVRDIDLVCDTMDYVVDTSGGWDRQRYQGLLTFFVERSDDSRLYSALFDEDLKRLSERTPKFPECPLDPMDYAELVEKVRTQDTGDHVVHYDPHVVDAFDVYFHWRWIPTGDHDDRVLLVVGISKHTVDTALDIWFVYGILALLTVSALYILTSMIFITADRPRLY